MIGTLTRSSFGTLSRRDRKYAWVSSSSNLYQFLVLNQRYSIGHGDQKTGQLTVVSEEAIDGLSRIVGIPNPPFNNLFEDGGIGKQTSTNQLLVFKDPKYKTVQQPMIPTFDYFIDIVNSYRGKNNPRLPSIIAEN